MELGATVCRARSVACGECPAHSVCRAVAGGDPTSVGRLALRKPTVKVLASALVVSSGKGVLLLPTSGVVVTSVRGLGRPLRESLGGLHQGFFAPPQTPWYARREGDSDARLTAAWRAWLRDAGISDQSLRRSGRVRHAITHHDLRLEVYQLDVDAREAALLDERVDSARRWSTLREGEAGVGGPPLSTPARRCLMLRLDSRKTG